MENQNSNQAARVFAGAFAESLAASLTEAGQLPWRIKMVDAPDLAKRAGQSVHFRLTLSGALRGECFAELGEQQVIELTSDILRRPLPGDEYLEAMAKIIATAMEGVTASLAPTYGEIAVKVQPVEGLAFGGMFVVPLAASGGNQQAMPIVLYFDPQLLAALSAQHSTQSSNTQSSNPQPANNKSAAEPATSPLDIANLKLVMDVDLNVSLRFGQRQLPLREVLELASGSVIELDRQVDDPVELLLDGKVIARGEAVIVDGNYGLRVTEIPQPIASHFFQ